MGIRYEKKRLNLMNSKLNKNIQRSNGAVHMKIQLWAVF